MFRIKQETRECLQKEWQLLENDVVKDLLQRVEDLQQQQQNQLLETGIKKTDGMAIRSKARWLQDAEKESKYFH